MQLLALACPFRMQIASANNYTTHEYSRMQLPVRWFHSTILLYETILLYFNKLRFIDTEIETEMR